MKLLTKSGAAVLSLTLLLGACAENVDNRQDRRDDRQDCRQDETRVGGDTRDCRQDARAA